MFRLIYVYVIISVDFSHRHKLCKRMQGVLAETCSTKFSFIFIFLTLIVLM